MLRDQTLELLGRFGLTAEATLDEQQLIDPAAIDALIEASGIRPTDTVLEIGPGAGNITAGLAARASKVIAVEKNEKFIPLLKERFSDSKVEVVLGDALAIYLPAFDVLVSNPPYAITEALIHRLERLRFRAASLVVPSTLARALVANRREPDYTKLTLETRLFFDTEVVSEVKPESYHPEPKTATSIIVLRPRVGLKPFEAVMRRVLRQGDRKTENALREAMIATASMGFPSTKRAVKQTVEELGLSEAILDERVARLSLGDVSLVYEKLENRHT
ncbi:MAG: rRNA adenine N-6-methyltransferase family protein [Candidatus Bathyarchaeota archaeon]|nr:rRNA adenine N-6-methyltransferase family protein [Candidatus Bathyarchaeota archaeon]